MSDMRPTQGAEQDNTPMATPPTHPQRVLACESCKQRKVKCDRRFPCANCMRTGAQCVPATAVARRQRRRRLALPEQVLLERLWYYEGLLRRNHIGFDTLYRPAKTPSEDGRSASDTAQLETDGMAERTPASLREAMDLWHAISQVTLDSDDEVDHDDGDSNVETLTSSASANESLLMRYGVAVTKAKTDPPSPRSQPQYEDSHQPDDYLFLVRPGTNANTDLSTSHPGQAQVFRLWQVYLDNVNPLLKVTHTPTLQPRIIDAVSNLANVGPALEALLFSIYCLAVVALDDDECWAFFQSARKDLLARYQAACRQALAKCRIWETTDMDALTAFYLYLIPVSSKKDIPYLSCMLAAAFRIAQRMGIHSEASNAKCNALEAEMRRRLWWSLVTFDYRVCELLDYKSTTLLPTWDCKIPLSVNDFELRPDMSHAPNGHEKPTEALFAVVRSELADFVRHSVFHINFVNPALNAIARYRDVPVAEGEELRPAERLLDERYLSSCDVEDRLHYMTIWTTRASIARARLLAYYQIHSDSSVPETEEQRNAATSYAVAMLESDTKLRTSPLVKGFLWFVSFYLPALASLYILNDLRKWPASAHAEEAWRAIADNYEAVAMHSMQDGADEQRNIYLEKFSQLVLRAWDAHEQSSKRQGRPPASQPRIVSDVKSRICQMGPAFAMGHGSAPQAPSSGMMDVSGTDDSRIPSVPLNMGKEGSTGPVTTEYPSDLFDQGLADVDMGRFWTGIDWTGMQGQGP